MSYGPLYHQNSLLGAPQPVTFGARNLTKEALWIATLPRKPRWYHCLCGQPGEEDIHTTFGDAKVSNTFFNHMEKKCLFVGKI